MKKRFRLLGAALAVYALLLLLLWLSERNAQDATIRNFGDAVWYSIITMTTVGYGDTSPVTAPGRVLGVLFAFASVGILTALISLGVGLLRGELLPRLRLMLARGRQWYIFTEDSPESRALASDLLERDEDALIIFPAGTGEGLGSAPVRISLRWRKLCALRGSVQGVCLFCLGPSREQNYTSGLRAARAGVETYALADPVGEKLPPSLHLFSPEEAAARRYWLEHPLCREERQVVLIGAGDTARAVLEQALLVNVFPDERRICYHVFGDLHAFPLLHRELCAALGPEGTDGDTLIFHEEDWKTRPELLAGADRMILAAGEDAQTLELCRSLKRWFVCPKRLHLRLDEPVPGLTCFGGAEDLVNGPAVMQDELNRRARLMHRIYSENSADPVPWEELSPFLQKSNIAAADHIPVKVGSLLELDSPKEPSGEELELAYQRFCAAQGEKREALRRCEHRRWMRFHRMYNWTWGEKRDNPGRRHPLLVPYEQLGAQEQAKDDYAWELLGRLARMETP